MTGETFRPTPGETPENQGEETPAPAATDETTSGDDATLADAAKEAPEPTDTESAESPESGPVDVEGPAEGSTEESDTAEDEQVPGEDTATEDPTGEQPVSEDTAVEEAGTGADAIAPEESDPLEVAGPEIVEDEASADTDEVLADKAPLDEAPKAEADASSPEGGPDTTEAPNSAVPEAAATSESASAAAVAAVKKERSGISLEEEFKPRYSFPSGGSAPAAPVYPRKPETRTTGQGDLSNSRPPEMPDAVAGRSKLPANWYPDPSSKDGHTYRWWDGDKWGEDVQVIAAQETPRNKARVPLLAGGVAALLLLAGGGAWGVMQMSGEAAPGEAISLPGSAPTQEPGPDPSVAGEPTPVTDAPTPTAEPVDEPTVLPEPPVLPEVGAVDSGEIGSYEQYLQSSWTDEHGEELLATTSILNSTSAIAPELQDEELQSALENTCEKIYQAGASSPKVNPEEPVTAQAYQSYKVSLNSAMGICNALPNAEEVDLVVFRDSINAHVPQVRDYLVLTHERSRFVVEAKLDF